MTDIPHDTIVRIAALKLSPKKQMEVLKIIADMAVSRRERGTVLHDDWMPSQSDVEYGVGVGLSLDEVAAVAQRMRFWAGANSNRVIARKANWSMTFKGFLRREADQRKGRNGAMDVLLELEERAECLNGTGHNGANGHVRGHRRNGAAAGGGLLSLFGSGDTGGSKGDR